MVLQSIAIFLYVLTTGFAAWCLAAVTLGIGTAMVYPVLLAAIGDLTDPASRATAVGVYRFWRDSGYAFGAILAGVVADRVGMRGAIAVVAALTLISGAVVAIADDKLH
jgi:MFS family permease